MEKVNLLQTPNTCKLYAFLEGEWRALGADMRITWEVAAVSVETASEWLAHDCAILVPAYRDGTKFEPISKEARKYHLQSLQIEAIQTMKATGFEVGDLTIQVGDDSVFVMRGDEVIINWSVEPKEAETKSEFRSSIESALEGIKLKRW